MPQGPNNPVGQNPGNPPSTGVIRPDQRRAGNQAKTLAFNDIPKDFTLMRARSKWRARAKGGVNEDFDNLMVLSTALRHGKGVTWRSNVANWAFAPDEIGPLLDKESNSLISEAEKALSGRVLDKCEKVLLEKYKTAVSALRQYAHGDRGATVDKVKASVRGFTNLKLFVNHGGDLHSPTGKNKLERVLAKVKLERTLAKIPEIVLKNASPDVTVSDYAKADLQKTNLTWTGREQRLLSFHGFKVTGSLFGRGDESRAYRQNLRALTASAHLLGGPEKALEVKQLLAKIDNNPIFGRGDIKKEDMVKSALENLAIHGDADALIEDLTYKLERRKLLGNIWRYSSPRYSRDYRKRFYSDIAKKTDEMHRTPHRVTVIRNVAGNFKNAELRNYYLRYPSELVRTLHFMSQTDPVDFVIKSDFKEKVKAAVIVLGDWVTTMTPTGSKEREDLSLAILKLNKIEREKKQARPKRDKIEHNRRQARRKLNKVGHRKLRSRLKSRKTEHKEKRTHALYCVAREFGAIDKSQMSIEDQCAVLSSCLQNPFGDRDAHLANVASQKAARNLEQDGKEDIDQDVVNENEDKSKDDGDRKDDLDNSSKPGSSPVLRPPDGLQTLLLALSSENPKTILESLDDNEDSDVEINDDIDGDGGVIEEFPKQQRPADEDDDWAPLLEMDVALAAAAKAKESEDNNAIDDNPDSANESDNTDDVKEDI